MKKMGLVLRSVMICAALFCLVLTAYAEQDTVVSKVNPQAIIVSDVCLEPGESVRIQPKFVPEDANQGVSYTSNKKTVATVGSGGVVKARKIGKATITVKAKKGGAKKKLIVTVAYRDTGANYFFYGIGNANYLREEDRLPGCITDVNKLATAFRKARFTGREFHTIDVRIDQGRYGMLAMLMGIAANPNITENDTTIVYYSGHGNGSNIPGYKGALVGIDGLSLTVEEIRMCLDPVPGTVVLILDSCFSGQFIQTKGAMSPEDQAAAFEKSVLDAFAQGASAGGTSQVKALTDSPVSSKYKIITASRPLQYSYSIGRSGSEYGLFSRYVTAAIGNNRPADTNKDKRVTLNELYKYASKKVKQQVASINRYMPQKKKIAQRVMVWPDSDKSFVFAAD